MPLLASQYVLNFEVGKKGAGFGCPIGRFHSVGVPILSTSVLLVLESSTGHIASLLSGDI